MLHLDDGVGQQLQFLLKALRVLGQSLFLLVGLLVGSSLRRVFAFGNGFSPGLLFLLLFLLSLSLGLFLLLFFLGYLTLALLLVEAVVGTLQEGHHVVEFLQVERSIDVQRTVVVDGISERSAILQIGTAHPAVAGVVAGIGIQPFEDGDEIQRKLVAGLERLAVVEWRTEMAQRVVHGVFPRFVAVGIEVLVDGGVGFLHLGVGGRLEVHVEVLRQVPTQREVAVPEELFVERQRQLRPAQVFHVALLQL